MNTQRSQISPEDIAIKDITIEEKGGAQIANAEIDNDVPTLISLFNSTFEDYNTRLVLGDDEPIYIPAGDDTGYHQIVFAHGVLPVRSADSSRTTAIGIAPMGETRPNKQTLKKWKLSRKPLSGLLQKPPAESFR